MRYVFGAMLQRQPTRDGVRAPLDSGVSLAPPRRSADFALAGACHGLYTERLP